MSLETVDETVNLAKQLKQTLNNVCFNLRKLCSNSRNICEKIAEDTLVEPLTKIIDDNYNQRLLGIHWNLYCDEFSFQPKNGNQTHKKMWT